MDESSAMTGSGNAVARRVRLLPRIAGYGALLLIAAALFFWIRSFGETLVAPAAGSVSARVANAVATTNVPLRLLIALASVIVFGRVLAKLLSRFGQPPVIGEVLAGILLGPSLLGPELSAYVMPAAVAPALNVVAQLGVILYMFCVGLETNAGVLRRRAYATVATSHASILLPFLLGSALALMLYPRLSSADVPFTHFALFLGVAMSITAFPVLARILTDRRMTGTELGIVALACAAIDDLTAWCLLALVIGITRAQVGDGLMVAGGAVIYIATMFFVVRPFLGRLVARVDAGRSSNQPTAWMFVALLLSTIATESIGIHAIFGAFLLGAVMPHDSAVSRTLARQLEPVVTVLLLPAFFAYTGMRTRIDMIAGADQWMLCGLIVAVATLGKFGGTLLAARLTGLDWRNSAGLGALMNTRGLMELIVLNVGLDLHVISPTLFAMMVIMALATTMTTAPVLRLLKF
jgi:Kef-type K+ transport system membrane component KefB